MTVLADSFGALWRDICSTSSSALSDPRYQLVRSVLWHDRPRAAVFRFVLKDERGHSAYYLKLYKGTSTAWLAARREYDALQILDHHLKSEDEFSVVSPVMLLPHFPAFVTREFIGTNLYAYFKQSTRIWATHARLSQAAETARRLAKWLTLFQSAPLPSIARDPPLDSVFRNAANDLTICYKTGMFSYDTVARVKGTLTQSYQLASTIDLPLVPCNADAKLWNILIHRDGTLCALDFAGCSTGSPCHDVARLWVGLNWLSVFPFNSSFKIRHIQHAFIRECAETGVFALATFDFLRLSVALEVAAFYTTVPRDRYRRNLRNRMFFRLICRYFNDLARTIAIEATDHAQSRVKPASN